MKILHTADWHIGQFKGPVVDGVNLRLQDTVKCLEYMVEVAQKEKPDIVCISGDIFHQEQIGPVRYSDEMIIATDTITKLADIAKGVIVMRGTPNHDGSGQFRVLDRMFVKTSHVHIITAPTVLHTPYLRYGRNVQNIQFHTSKTREKPGEKSRRPSASMDITGRKKRWKA